MKVFGRSWVLYFILFAVFWAGVDLSRIQLARLNYLRDQEGYFRKFLDGETAVDLKKFKEGIAYYRQVLKLIKFKSLAYANLGFCYFHLQDYAKAWEYYKKAVEADPSQYTFYYDLGIICFKTGDFKEAVQLLNKGLAALSGTKAVYRLLLSSPKLDKDAYTDVARFLRQAKEDGMTMKEVAFVADLTNIQNAEIFIHRLGKPHLFWDGWYFQVYGMLGVGRKGQ